MNEQQAIEIGCDIDAANEFGPVDLDWDDLTAFCRSTTPTSAGVTTELPVRFGKAISRLIEREQSCCQFLNFDVQRSGEYLTLTVTSENTDAIPVIEALLGLRDTTDA